MSDDLNLIWEPPGPVAARFMAEAPIIGGLHLINGPVGSGKTTTCTHKSFVLASEQMPSTRRTAMIDGVRRRVRRFKLCVVRDTYRQLWKTTLPSWWNRMPREAGRFVGAENGPASHDIDFVIGDGTAIEFHADFLAIGENAVEDVLRGYEPTYFYLNEMDLLSWDVYRFAKGRAGRFPDMSEGGPSSYGVLADCNAPEFEADLYREVFTKSAEELEALGCKLFQQPSGLSPQAENTRNLPAGYYENQVKGNSVFYVSRMVENKPGFSRAGMPVHPEFKDQVHVSIRELEPVPGIGLVIGIDPRTFPSAVFLQRLPSGQRRFLDELQAEPNTGPRRFGKALAEKLHDAFPTVRPAQIRGIVDPSAAYGADKEAGEQDWIQIVRAVTGIDIRPAPTNNLDMRREAIKKPLLELIDGEPALLISSRCKLLRAGLNSGFHFRKLNVSGADKYATEVEKNKYADICEAAEYACLTDGAQLEIRERQSFTDQKLRDLASTAQHDWDPFDH